MEWKKIEEVGYPEDGEKVVVWDNRFDEARMLYYNGFHECWDNEEGDDYECDLDIERIPAYIIIDEYNG